MNNLSAESKNIIMADINTSYVNDIQLSMCGRRWFKITSDVCELGAKILIAVVTVISFAAGVWRDIYWLSYLAGCISAFSSALLLLADYFQRESKQRNDELNRVLHVIGVDPMVDITDVAVI